MAGTKGYRFALPNSRIMIHQPWGGVGGTSEDVRIQAEEILKMRKRLNEIMVECTGQTTEKIETDSDRDFFMDPQEAKLYGIIDEVVMPKKSK